MRRRVGLLAAVLVAVTGCGGHTHPTTGKPATSTAAAASDGAPSRRCTEPGVRARPVRLRTSDGVMLSGVVVGSGRSGRC